jgi:hypothetical protein
MHEACWENAASVMQVAHSPPEVLPTNPRMKMTLLVTRMTPFVRQLFPRRTGQTREEIGDGLCQGFWTWQFAFYRACIDDAGHAKIQPCFKL